MQVIINTPKLPTAIEKRQCMLLYISAHQRSVIHLRGEGHWKKTETNHEHSNAWPKLNATATLHLEMQSASRI